MASVIHAHEYDKNLTLDVITDKIYDAFTRKCCMRLSPKKLRDIEARLRQSPDYSDVVAEHIDKF